jgi:small GTP-binding protein
MDHVRDSSPYPLFPTLANKTFEMHFPLLVKKGPATHTVGVEFGSRPVSVADKTVKLNIWDTAGQERFQSVTRSYYRGAAGALVVYDITNRATFEHLGRWIQDAKSLARPDITLVIVGNKSDTDSASTRKVSFLEGTCFAQEHDCMFLETSAMTGENIQEAFNLLASSLVFRIDNGELDAGTLLPTSARTTVVNTSGDHEKCLC